MAGFESKRELNEFDLDQIIPHHSDPSIKRTLREWLIAQETEFKSINQSINQSIKQSINQSINQSVDQSFTHSLT